MRAKDSGIEVTIVAPDPGVPPLIFAPDRGSASEAESRPKLVVSYLSSRMFSLLCLCPSAEHALLLGCESEKVFRVSSKEMFLKVFSPTNASVGSGRIRWLQRLRGSNIPESLGMMIPPSHFLDENGGFVDGVKDGLMILSSRFLDWFEMWVFVVARARIVEGQEPWKQWNRATAIHLDGHAAVTVPNHTERSGSIVSVLRTSY